MQNKDNETIFQENEIRDGWMMWECSGCKAEWTFEADTPEDNGYNYCPGCGRKIVEFRQHEDEEDV